MAHTTSAYYRDRLGFEPDYEKPHKRSYATPPNAAASTANGDSSDRAGASGAGSAFQEGASVREKGGHFAGSHVGNGRIEDSMPGGVYEENLNKFKGTDGLRGG